MTTENLSAVAIHTISQYNEAGKTLVSSYRTGVRRLLDLASNRTNELLEKNSLPLVNEEVKSRLLGMQQKYYGFLTERVEADTNAAVTLMNYVAATSTNNIETVAARAAKIESPLATSLLNNLEAVQLPLAKLSADIADRIVAGVKQIEARVSGESKDGVQDVVAKEVKDVKEAKEAKAAAATTAAATTTPAAR